MSFQKYIAFAFLVFFGFSKASSQEILQNTFYKDGEEITLQLRYGFIIGGKVTLSVNEKKGLFHLVGMAKTTGMADKLFRVKDIYESYIDKVTGLPVFAIQNVKEGKSYTYYNEMKFNRNSNLVISSLSGEHAVPKNIMDMTSVFYYIRRMDLSKVKEGDVFKLNTFFSDKIFPFEIHYRGKEEVETPKGKINCLKFAPKVEPGRVFKSEDDMYVWFSDDANRIPVLVSMQMVVGHVYCEIIDYKNLMNETKFRKK